MKKIISFYKEKNSGEEFFLQLVKTIINSGELISNDNNDNIA